MKKKTSLFLLFLIVSIMSFSLSAAPTLAVLPFESENEPALATTASDLFQSALFNSKLVTLIERQKLDILVKEQSLSLTGLTTSQANKIGGLLNVDLICMGKLTKLKQGYSISTRIVDVTTGDIRFSDTIQFAVSSQIKEAVTLLFDGFEMQMGDTPAAGQQQQILKRKQDLLKDPNARTPTDSLWRSAICPGLGQFYNKQTVLGVVFIASESFMLMGFIMKIADIKPPTGEIPAPASVIGISLGVLHSLNIIHAYAFSPYHKKSENAFYFIPDFTQQKVVLEWKYETGF